MTHVIWLAPILYFLIAWAFPWESVQWSSSISISYLFDLIFVIGISLGFKLFSFEYRFNLRGLLSRLIGIIAAALFSLFLINLFGLKTPFKYIENLVLQILILAPIIEELIFRHTFFGIFEDYFISKNKNLILNSAFFSLSHLSGIWFLPPEYKHFIIIQLVYTFLLGWMCAKSRLKSESVIEPIILHFVFNFIFYIAVIKGII